LIFWLKLTVVQFSLDLVSSCHVLGGFIAGPNATDVTLVHPAKAAGRNEMPFGRDTLVVPSNIMLYSGRSPTAGRGDSGVGTPNS